MYADSTTAETTAETTTDGFDADELRLALEASTKETSADVLAVELEFDSRGRGTSEAETARSAGRSLAAKFWISQALDAEDVLDASADGFYDVHGDAFDAMEKLPELHELLRRPSTRGEEALVVDRRTDMFLSELDVLARETCDAAPTAQISVPSRENVQLTIAFFKKPCSTASGFRGSSVVHTMSFGFLPTSPEA